MIPGEHGTPLRPVALAASLLVAVAAAAATSGARDYGSPSLTRTSGHAEKEAADRRSDPAPLVLHDVNVVPMTEERVIRGVSVLVRDGRVAAIAPREGLRVPPGARSIDAAGAYLLPGLIEMHVHLRKRIDLDLFLGHGVTTARNMDGTRQVLEWRSSIAQGTLLGPELTSGSPFLHRHATDNPDRFVSSESDARRLVREYRRQGYDYIKIAELDDGPFFALMDEARSVGIPVVGHIPNYELDLERILEQGMASIEHLEELYRVYFEYEADASKIPSFVELVRRSGVPISTLITREQILNDLFAERQKYLTPERLAWIERFNGPKGLESMRGTIEAIDRGDWERHWVDIDFLLRLAKELYDAGVVIVPGTDSGGSISIAGIGLHQELALLESGGFRPYEALRTATVNAAAVLGSLDRKGSVEVGKDADLLLVRGNPLADIANVKDPIGLVVHGHWLGAEELEGRRSRTWADEQRLQAQR